MARRTLSRATNRVRSSCSSVAKFVVNGVEAKMACLRASVEEFSLLETDVETSESSAIEVGLPVPRAGGTAAEIDTVTDNQKLISTPTEESEESLSGVKYCTHPDRNRRRPAAHLKRGDSGSHENR